MSHIADYRPRHVRLRRVKMVVDLEDPLAPEFTVDQFLAINGFEPKPPRYRIIDLDLAICPEDRQPIIAAECGCCPKFHRRYDGSIRCG